MKLAELLPWVARAVRTHADGAPEDMLLADLGRAATEFFADAKVLMDVIQIDTQAGVTDYLLDECPSLPNRVWHRVDSICLNGITAQPGPTFGACDGGCEVGRHTVFWDRDTHTVHIARAPVEDAVGALRLHMIVTFDGSTGIDLPEFVRHDSDFFDGLVATAVARALEDLAPPAAEAHRRKAQRAITRIVTSRLHGWGGGQARMTARGFIAR